MNSFGLGLVLNFVDNASAGMNSATRTFMQMSATADSMTSSVGASASELAAMAFSLGAVGDTFSAIGSSITNTFMGITESVINTGMTLQGYRMQLAALYGSTEAGEAKLAEIKEYAMSSVFDIESLIPAVTMMKAVGIEAMQEVTTSSGNATQRLLDYASDIAAMVPNMRNTYGTGVRAAMGALKEYIAEGNALSLKRGAGLDIVGILGEDKGSTIEERTQQIADLVEKLNIVGYTANLAGTPTQRLSNMQDALFNSLSQIADSGVFERYCGLLETLSNWVFSLVEDEETFNTITSILGDTISTMLAPVQSLLEFVIAHTDAIIEWAKAHPVLVRNILLAVAAVGAMLLVGGKLLKLMSSFALAGTGLRMLRSLPSALGIVGGAFKTLIANILPLVALGAILYFVWTRNIFGIRDAITSTFGQLRQVFSLVREAWDDNTLSAESFQTARELGILPLIESLLQLRYYWGFFKEGFATGFKAFFDGLAQSLSFLKIFGIDIVGIAKSLGEFLKNLLGIGQEANWEKIGEIAGKFAAIALSLFTVVKALNLLRSVSNGVRSLPVVGKLLGGKDAATDSVAGGGFLGNPVKVLKTLASISIIVGGVVLLITALGALRSIPGFAEFMSSGFTVITQLFKNLIPLAATAVVLGGVATLLSKITNPKDAAKGLADLAIVLGGTEALIIAMGALYSIPGFDDFLSNGVTVLTTLFDSLVQIAADAVVLGAITVLLGRLSTPAVTAKGLASLAIILGGFDILITAIGALSSIPGFSNFINSGVTTLSKLFEAMSIFATGEFWLMIGAITALGVISPAVVALGIAGLAEVIAGMGLIVSAFAALSMIPGFNDFLQRGGETLALLFEQVGLAIGSLVGGVLEGVTSSLPETGNNLSRFAENLGPFFDMCETAPIDKMGDFMLKFSEAMLLLTANDLLSFFTGDLNLANIGQQLADFGTNAKPFFDAVASYPQEGVDKSSSVFQALSSIGAYEFRSGGVAQFFTGEVNLGVIGEQLAAFAPNGLTFFNAVANYSEAGLEKSPKVFEALAGIGDYDFKTGGVAQFFTGETSLDVIGTQLASFAPNGLIFFNYAANYSEAGMEKTPKVFQALAGIGDFDFKTGGVAQFFTGETSLDVIGTQLAAFAPNGATFFNTVATYSQSGIDKSKDVFAALSSIGAYEFKTGGLAQLFTGGTDLEEMGEQLSDFATEATTAFTLFANYPQSGIDNGLRVIGVLGQIGNSNLNTGGLFSLFTGSIDIVDIGSQLSSFGTQAKAYFEAVSGLTSTSLSNGSRVIQVLSELGNYTFRTDGLAQMFTGSVDISNLANNLSAFGNGSRVFFTVASRLPEEGFTKAVTLFSTLSRLDSLTTLLFSIGEGNLTSFSEELVVFIENCQTFFSMASTLNVEGLSAVTGALEPFFMVIVAFDVSKLGAIATGINDMGEAANNFSVTMGNVTSEVQTNTAAIVTAITDCTNSSISVLNSFVARGSGIGSSLMQRIASGISSNAYRIRSAIQNAVSNITVTARVNTVVVNSSGNKPLGLATGGYVKETGLAVLHPNEVVVNDTLTRRLGTFLESIENPESPTSVIADRPVVNNTQSSIISNAQNYVVSNTTQSSQPVEKHYDNSVTFEAGSVVIQLANASESELEKAAEKLMTIIARKQQLHAMAVRA